MRHPMEDYETPRRGTTRHAWRTTRHHSGGLPSPSWGLRDPCGGTTRHCRGGPGDTNSRAMRCCRKGSTSLRAGGPCDTKQDYEDPHRPGTTRHRHNYAPPSGGLRGIAPGTMRRCNGDYATPQRGLRDTCQGPRDTGAGDYAPPTPGPRDTTQDNNSANSHAVSGLPNDRGVVLI